MRPAVDPDRYKTFNGGSFKAEELPSVIQANF